MLKVKGISVFYGDLQVLWDVSFSVQDRELLVLLGANGAGKSTVIRAVSALLPLRSGAIEFDGVRLDLLPAHKIIEHGVVHVPEGRRLFAQMSVEENLVMGSMNPRARARRKATMAEVYELFPRLAERRKQNAGTLSGGEQQMLAMGRGLMSLPRLIMLDEPSLGLAPIVVAGIFEVIKKIRDQGVGVLLVEQNAKQSLSVCTNAVVLENGRVALCGTGEELLCNPGVKTAFLGM